MKCLSQGMTLTRVSDVPQPFQYIPPKREANAHKRLRLPRLRKEPRDDKKSGGSKPPPYNTQKARRFRDGQMYIIG